MGDPIEFQFGSDIIDFECCLVDGGDGPVAILFLWFVWLGWGGWLSIAFGDIEGLHWKKYNSILLNTNQPSQTATNSNLFLAIRDILFLIWPFN